jgi:predicted nucleotidyltransferase
MVAIESRANVRQADLLAPLAEACRAVYGPRLVSLAVYGSVARGRCRPDSDVDLLVIATDLPRGRMHRTAEFGAVEQRLKPLLARLASEGVYCVLSPLLKTPDEAKAGSPLFLDMIEEAVLLHDEGGFFRGLLDDFAARLKRLGARKVSVGDMWYWDLKPDYKIGEVFEI